MYVSEVGRGIKRERESKRKVELTVSPYRNWIKVLICNFLWINSDTATYLNQTSFD